jgi:hypothetical protein
LLVIRGGGGRSPIAAATIAAQCGGPRERFAAFMFLFLFFLAFAFFLLLLFLAIFVLVLFLFPCLSTTFTTPWNQSST